MLQSIRLQLTLGIILAFSILLGSGGFLLYWSVRKSLYDQFDATLLLKANIVMTNAQQQEGVVHVYFSDQYLEEFDDAIASEFFQVTDMQGESVERSDSLESDNLPIRHGTREAPAYWNMELPNGRPGRAIGVQFTPRVASLKEGQRPVNAVAVVASDRTRLLKTLSDLRVSLWFIGAIWMILAILSVPLLLRSLLRPLSDVAGETDRLDTNAHHYRFRTEGMPAELRPITKRLNEFLARLEASYNRERQFSSDIAHELRTPLSELRMMTEVALKWPEEVSTETMESAHEIALQMQALVERLLELARAEQSNRVALDMHVVNLADCIHESFRLLAETVADKQLHIKIDEESSCNLHTDPALLRSILQNLADNAVHYAQRETKIHCRLGQNDTRFRFLIANSAPEVSQTDLEHLFDRLWRGDSARSGSRSGLGLTIAKSHADRLGYTLTCRLPGPGLIEFSLEGPLVT